MYTTVISDLSRTILFPKKKDYAGSLNDLYRKIRNESHFTDYFRVNDDLLGFLKTLKDTLNLYVFTTGTVQNDPAIADQLHEVFRATYNVRYIGDLPKDDPRAYTILCEKLEVKPGETIFIDDEPRNVWAAGAAGLKTIQYESSPQVIAELKELLGLRD